MDDDKTNAPQQSDVGHTPLPPLPQDDGTPFTPPTDPLTDAVVNEDVRKAQDGLDPTHPTTDTNIEQEEWYDEDLGGAAEASEPNAGDAVGDYDPENDSRRKDQ